MLRWLTAGESHGPALSAILEGLPAGIEVKTADLQAGLARRRLGFGRGARQKFEEDHVSINAGIRHGLTQGGPIAISIANSEWPKWEKIMSADPINSADISDLARNAPLTRPRPGHADLAGMQKYSFDDARPILERASARETAARVTLGVIAQNFLRQLANIEVISHVISIGTIVSDSEELPTPADLAQIDADPVRCFSKSASALMQEEISLAHKEGDTLGGVIEVIASNVPVGLGSHVHWDRRLDSRLAAALMGIQAIKGVEIGDGFASAKRRGSVAHDEIFKEGNKLIRTTGRSGGTEGGMSNGELLRVRAAMKPISTVPRSLATVDVATGLPATANTQRSDACAVPAAGVISEAMVALVLADAVIEKFGGDHLLETKRNLDSYLSNLKN